MTGIVPMEGNTTIGKWLFNNTSVNLNGTAAPSPTAFFVLGLFTAPSVPTTATVWSGITQASFTGYAEVSLNNSGWTVNSTTGIATYAPITFTCSGSTSGGAVYGYYIRSTGNTLAGGTTSSGTGTNTIIAIEVDTNSGVPYIFNNGDTYQVTPTITIA